MKKKPEESLLQTALHPKLHISVGKLRAVFLILAVFAAGAAAAEDAPLPWEIDADRLVHQQNPEKIIAEGNVLMQQYRDGTPTGLKIEADKINYDVSGKFIDGSGNLRFMDNENEVRAAEASLALDRQVGFFREASIFWRQDSLFVSADLIEKNPGDMYQFTNGRYTTCPVEDGRRPDWSIWGSDLKISLDDYAAIKHATFRVKDFPVFYLPYLRLPIGSKKKTGFLFPEYSTSHRNGTGIITPFFVNLAPSYDLTLYPGYYSERGPMVAGEFRYAAGYNSRGTFMISYLEDELQDSPDDEYKSDGRLRTNSTRYWFRGKADHDFGNRMVAKLDLDIVSDHDYLQEFQKGMTGFDRSNSNFLKVYNRGLQTETIDLRENTLQLSKIWTTTELQTEVEIIDDEGNDPGTITPPWALPKIGYSGLMPFLNTPADFLWDTEYVYYWRDEGVGAHRINLFPQISGPVPLSPYLESSYNVGLQETLYFIEPHDSASEILYDEDYDSRTFYNLQLSSATTLSRDYKISAGKYRKLRHAVRPELSYILVKGTGQDDLPLLDNEDRITEKNWLQYSLNNYFRAIALEGAPLFRANFSSFKINQVYDLDRATHPFSDISLEFIIRGFQNLFFRYETAVSMYGAGVTAFSLETRYANKRGDRLTLDYNYKKNADIYPPYFYTEAGGDSLSELRTYIESRLSRLFSVRFDNIYSVSSNNTVSSTFSLIYHNPCWNLEFAANKTPDDTGFYVVFTLAGLSSPIDFEVNQF